MTKNFCYIEHSQVSFELHITTITEMFGRILFGWIKHQQKLSQDIRNILLQLEPSYSDHIYNPFCDMSWLIVVLDEICPNRRFMYRHCAESIGNCHFDEYEFTMLAFEDFIEFLDDNPKVKCGKNLLDNLEMCYKSAVGCLGVFINTKCYTDEYYSRCTLRLPKTKVRKLKDRFWGESISTTNFLQHIKFFRDLYGIPTVCRHVQIRIKLNEYVKSLGKEINCVITNETKTSNYM